MNKNPVIIFISNYFNHHQRPFSDEMYKILGDRYIFLETEKMEEERIKMGWGEKKYPSYVVKFDEYQKNVKIYQELIDNAKAVILGSAPASLIRNREKNRKIVFRYSERIFKHKMEIWKYPIRFIKWRKLYPQYKQSVMLCSSAYTAPDFLKFGLYKNRCFKWGYFPIFKEYNCIEKIIENKKSMSFLWVARLIEWKHPEVPIQVAKKLKDEGYDFTLNIIGNGNLEYELKRRIEEEGLSNMIHMLGAMNPTEVRRYMEESEVFLFTSDRNEGWGAVLNEAMNSGCVCIASHAIGSVPYLLCDKENGLIYKDGNIEDLYKKIQWLLDNPQKRKEIALNAYYTIKSEWNAEIAAKRFLKMIESMTEVDDSLNDFESGICSKAEKIDDDWYKNE